MCYRQFLVSDTFILVSSSSAPMRACVRACVRACMRACVRAFVRACVRVYDDDDDGDEVILGIIALVAVRAEW